ncbi:hypothetical protein pb186bvf_009176 [Paramecium bursaria]
MYSDQDSNCRVGYFYHPHIGRFHYGKEHPMKPKRISMAHNLIVNYGLYRKMDIYMSRPATIKELLKFHDPDYIQYLSQFVSMSNSPIIQEYQNYTLPQNYITSDMLSSHLRSEFDLIDPIWQTKVCETNNIIPQTNSFRVGDSTDNPQFPGLYNFCQLSAGASIDAAHLLIKKDAEIAINWSGGLHHAKKREASGFCYINDIVIGILELLRVYQRVLYIDIDVHHGDGVEEAFLLTNRVMTLSFHQYGEDFFPGSGNLDSYGEGLGRYHSLNIPLKVGMSDDTFVPLFKSIITRVIETYKPESVVLQCGADSLCHDRLGGFNLSIRGHGECVEIIKKFGLPTMILGGGGYTIQNVARCWAYETGICLGMKIDAPIPTQEIYYEYYGPDYKLHFPIKQNVENKNKKEDLQKLVEKIFDYLKNIESAPGLQFHDTQQPFYPDHEMDLYMDNSKEMNLNQYEGNNYDGGNEIDMDPQNGFQIHKPETTARTLQTNFDYTPTCSCDLIIQVCEATCLCDTDCPNSQPQSIQNKRYPLCTELRDYNATVTYYNTINNINCIIYDNSPYAGMFAAINLIRPSQDWNIESFKEGYSDGKIKFINLSTISTTIGNPGYQLGQDIIAVYNATNYSSIDIYVSDLTGACLTAIPTNTSNAYTYRIQFGINTILQCYATNGSLLIENQLQDNGVFYNISKLGVATLQQNDNTRIQIVQANASTFNRTGTIQNQYLTFFYEKSGNIGNLVNRIIRVNIDYSYSTTVSITRYPSFITVNFKELTTSDLFPSSSSLLRDTITPYLQLHN